MYLQRNGSTSHQIAASAGQRMATTSHNQHALRVWTPAWRATNERLENIVQSTRTACPTQPLIRSVAATIRDFSGEHPPYGVPALLHWSCSSANGGGGYPFDKYAMTRKLVPHIYIYRHMHVYMQFHAFCYYTPVVSLISSEP